MLHIVPKWFIRYKFSNSLFLGLSVGTIFSIYESLEPEIYSLGGIALAVGILTISRLYNQILNVKSFYVVSILVELIMLCSMLFFLYKPYNYQSALILYIGYQSTFVFGSYLVRAETILLNDKSILASIDTSKQLGYLMGMGMSYLFYKISNLTGITDKHLQVYNLHYMLIMLEIIVIALITKSFCRSKQ